MLKGKCFIYTIHGNKHLIERLQVAGDTYIYKEIPESFIMMLENDLNYLKDHPVKRAIQRLVPMHFFRCMKRSVAEGFIKCILGK